MIFSSGLEKKASLELKPQRTNAALENIAKAKPIWRLRCQCLLWKVPCLVSKGAKLRLNSSNQKKEERKTRLTIGITCSSMNIDLTLDLT